MPKVTYFFLLFILLIHIIIASCAFEGNGNSAIKNVFKVPAIIILKNNVEGVNNIIRLCNEGERERVVVD